MITLGKVTKMIQAVIKEDAYYERFQGRITRGQVIPDEDPNACPWLGIYRRQADYEPSSIGYAVNQAGETDNWQGTLQVTVAILESNISNNEAEESVEDLIEGHVEHTIALFWMNTTLKGIVDMVKTVKVSYFYNYREGETLYTQGALIDLTLEVIGS